METEPEMPLDSYRIGLISVRESPKIPAMLGILRAQEFSPREGSV